jgi:uncharacterized protein (TIGR03643 family)
MTTATETHELIPAWEYVADTVMGGVSTGGRQVETYKGRTATVLRGDVSLQHNGGFVQIAADLNADGSSYDTSAWDGFELTVCGNNAAYDFRLRTDDLSHPWQSFRTDFVAPFKWRTVRLPFANVTPHKTDAKFEAARLRRISILAIGREMQAEIALAAVHLYRGKVQTKVDPIPDAHRSDIIEMALSDHVSFADIKREYGLAEKQVKALMRDTLKPGSYRAWRKRVRDFSDRRALYK